MLRRSCSLALLLAACGAPDADSTGTLATTDVSTSSSSASSSDTAQASTGDAPTAGGEATSSGTDTSVATGTSTDEPATTTDEPATTTGDSSSSGGDTTGGGVDDLPPTEGLALEAWLAGGAYKAWAAESKVHPSAGPHGGNVRTYINAALLDSLAGGDPMHPQGAATVKELYSGGVDTITGYAVMVKVAPDSAGGEGWYWYERAGDTIYADATGVGLCSGCHGAGVDYVLTPFPLQ